VVEVLGRWRSSDLTKAAFCRREGIASVTLNRWLAEFGETPSVPVSGPAFVEAVWGEGVDRALEVVLEPESTICPCCGKPMRKIGEARSEQLDYVPATIRVIETVRPTYACATCKDSVVAVPAPISSIQRSKATAPLLERGAAQGARRLPGTVPAVGRLLGLQPRGACEPGHGTRARYFTAS
jgi:ribosomal protein L34E